jgi:hypothetical protein
MIRAIEVRTTGRFKGVESLERMVGSGAPMQSVALPTPSKAAEVAVRKRRYPQLPVTDGLPLDSSVSCQFPGCYSCSNPE